MCAYVRVCAFVCKCACVRVCLRVAMFETDTFLLLMVLLGTLPLIENSAK